MAVLYYLTSQHWQRHWSDIGPWSNSRCLPRQNHVPCNCICRWWGWLTIQIRLIIRTKFLGMLVVTEPLINRFRPISGSSRSLVLKVTYPKPTHLFFSAMAITSGSGPLILSNLRFLYMYCRVWSDMNFGIYGLYFSLNPSLWKLNFN